MELPDVNATQKDAGQHWQHCLTIRSLHVAIAMAHLVVKRLMLQFAKALGGVVTALDQGRSKEGFVGELGARDLVDMTNEQEVSQTADRFDIIINWCAWSCELCTFGGCNCF